MKEINCNIIRDIFPLYMDDMTSEDTKELIEEHLETCEECRLLYEELEEDKELTINTIDSQKQTKELKNFKKFLLRKKIATIAVSVAISAVLLTGLATYMNHQITYIDYEDAGITIFDEDTESVYYKTGIKGNYDSYFHLDQESGEATIYFEQSLWDRYISCIIYPFDHVHAILKKDMISEVYVDSDGSKTMIWEATEKEKEDYFKRDKNQPLG